MSRRRWLLLRGAPLLALLGLSFVIMYANWIGQAPSVDDPRGDAVIVHAGQGERIGHAFDLMEAGAAPTLVVMFGESRRGLDRFCGRTEPYEIVCPTPDRVSTIGEAIALGDLAEERGWTSVVAVTSDYHLRRATYLDAKCSGIDVIASGAGQGVTRLEVVLRIGEEMAAMVQAALTSC